MATQIRCHKCGHFADKKLPACPKCEEPRRGVNKALHAARVNNHLYSMAQNA